MDFLTLQKNDVVSVADQRPGWGDPLLHIPYTKSKGKNNFMEFARLKFAETKQLGILSYRRPSKV